MATLIPNGEQEYLGYWNGSHWWLEPTTASVYRATVEGLRYEGSYVWFSSVAADRIIRGNDV